MPHIPVYGIRDITQRIKATLPAKWFGENTPVLDSVLDSLATAWVNVLQLLNYTIAQSRIATAGDTWLDIVAWDYFGPRLPRRQFETDASLRARIHANLLRDRCTRSAYSQLLLDLTGQLPDIFEPANPRDTGAYGSGTGPAIGHGGYGILGKWGNLDLPFQAFINVARPGPKALAMINGWDGFVGGYGTGISSYSCSASDADCAGDDEIRQWICAIAPAGTIIWIAFNP